ncbi:YHYH domain-containing protein, partial [Candidatus Dojkabacteria bacterium]|nr:YHYH domain-containing protein [Candidatus Dojkabacteria bacterium]
ICFISLIFVHLSFINTKAHPGNTDSLGCHTQVSTGYYHCHNEPDDISTSNETGNLTGEYDNWTPNNYSTNLNNSSSDLIGNIICSGFLLLISIGIISSIYSWLKDQTRTTESKKPIRTHKPIVIQNKPQKAEMSREKKKYLNAMCVLRKDIQTHFKMRHDYYALSDKTIEELWNKKPQNTKELLLISGLGNKKVSEFGNKILLILGVDQEPEISKLTKSHKLQELILNEIKGSTKSLKAREIKVAINKKYNTNYKRKDINRVLYSKLKDKVKIDSKYRWRLKIHKKRAK